jgi:hypothetical protein
MPLPLRRGRGRGKSYIRYIIAVFRRWDFPRIKADRQPVKMVSSTAKEVIILGRNQTGKTFRPSDWAERLAGVMSSFRPGGVQPGSHLSYSPWCIPTVIDGVKAIVVNGQLRDLEPMAWDFVINFAKDNQLQLTENVAVPVMGK